MCSPEPDMLLVRSKKENFFDRLHFPFTRIVNNILLKLLYVAVEGKRATVMKIAQYVWTFKEYNTCVCPA